MQIKEDSIVSIQSLSPVKKPIVVDFQRCHPAIPRCVGSVALCQNQPRDRNNWKDTEAKTFCYVRQQLDTDDSRTHYLRSVQQMCSYEYTQAQ